MQRATPSPSRPILLVGLPGAGKSTLAPLLAATLGLASHDSDALIAAARGRGVAALIGESEAAFRDEERRTVLVLLRGGPAVIAAGGGAWLDPAVRTAALAAALPIWLDAGLDTLCARLGDAMDRPLLSGEVRAKLAALKTARDPLYALAPLRIDADSEPEQALSAILAALEERAR